MKLKKAPVMFLVGLMALLFFAVSANAATFDLKLSNLGSDLADIEGIEFISFNGTASVTESADGTFTENGAISFDTYKTTDGTVTLPFYVTISAKFNDLTGAVSGNEISFDPVGQTVDIVLSYYTDITSTSPTEVTLATFEIGAGSGGTFIDAEGLYQEQNYYLTLLTDTDRYDIFEASSDAYCALLIMANFEEGDYQMTGQISAVPVPASVLLVGSGLLGLIGIRRRV